MYLQFSRLRRQFQPQLRLCLLSGGNVDSIRDPIDGAVFCRQGIAVPHDLRPGCTGGLPGILPEHTGVDLRGKAGFRIVDLLMIGAPKQLKGRPLRLHRLIEGPAGKQGSLTAGAGDHRMKDPAGDGDAAPQRDLDGFMKRRKG